MKPTLMTVAIVAALGLPGMSHAMSKAEYDAEVRRVDAEYESAKKRCDNLSGNAKDICVAEVKGAQKVGKAEAEARHKGTPKARHDARVARAEADYDVAKEKCDEYAGNSKDVCVTDANAALTRGKADAKVERESREASQRSAERTADARRDADKDVRQAEYKAAVERCDAFSGDAKTRCVADARTQFRIR